MKLYGKMLRIKFRQFDEKWLILKYKFGIENQSEHSLRSHDITRHFWPGEPSEKPPAN